MESTFTSYSYALMVLLVIRALGQIGLVIVSIGVEAILAMIFTLIYLGGIFGVFMKKRWGSIITMIVAVIDLLLSLTLVSGYYALSAASVDVLLMVLGYKEYRIRETP